MFFTLNYISFFYNNNIFFLKLFNRIFKVKIILFFFFLLMNDTAYSRQNNVDPPKKEDLNKSKSNTEGSK